MRRARTLLELLPRQPRRRRAADSQAFALKPSSLIAAAAADLARRDFNRCARGSDPYCFHRRHVARATCALDLIDRAIRDRYTGVDSGKRITRIIYGDAELLWAAYELCSPLGDGKAA